MRNFLLIDDHEIVRAGIASVLSELFKPSNIYEASDEATAIQRLKERPYDLIIMDVYIPGTDSFGLMEYIRAQYPEFRVLIFSMSAENIYASRFLKAGAKGFVSKNSGLAELKKAIDLVLNNRRYISSDLAEHLASGLNDKNSTSPFEKLSGKEFEITMMLISGKTTTEISRQLGISTSTTGTHKARIFTKLGVKNLLELVEMGNAFNLRKQ
ncbi:response regulator transcription factor [Flavihumibacter solisilvae]|uniref:LuxR family transcriptional regulator n=1 Tax=Flavihumibacter solisilvae TaxID=1349421 RepID=A0A0C1LH03_9BACT|nr:response regulator transcription factor [Flavihumibacter solisilvae]KIC94588.1 hypothetical protein OI18_10810 [Flavihumibacter solisilvae]